MQVHIAEKCRFFDILLCSVRVLAVIEDIFYLFIVRNRHGFGVNLAVDEIDVLGVLQFDTLLVSENSDIIKEDIMDRFAFESLNIHCLFGADTGYIPEGDIGPVGEESVLIVGIGSRDACALVGIAGRDEESGFADILHDDVIAVDVFAPSASTGSGFETASDVGPLEPAVFDHQTLHPTAELGTYDETAVCPIDGVVGDEEVALRTCLHTFLPHSAFHADTIVTAGEVAVDDERHLYVSGVHGIAVLRPVRAADGDAVNDKVLYARGHEMELRRVEQVHMLHEDILGVGDIHQMGSHLLLNDGVGSDIGHVELFLEVEGVPYFPVLAVPIRSEHSAHCRHLPPHIAVLGKDFGALHFLLFDRPPVDTLTVYRTVAGDGDVLQFGAVDEGVAFLGTVTQGIVLLDIEFLVGRAQDDGAIGEVEVEVTDEFDGSRQPFAIGHDEMSAALFLEVFECFGKRLGVIRHTVTDSIEIRQRDRVIRDDDFLDLLHRAGQVQVVPGILGLRYCSFAHSKKSKDSCAQI